MHVEDDMGAESIPAEGTFTHENTHKETFFVPHRLITAGIFFLLVAIALHNRQLVARETLPSVAAGTGPDRSGKNPLSRDSADIRW
jgi:hypothetical protein